MTELMLNHVGREIGSIGPDELQKRISRNEPVQVVDVREFPEFAGGRIACAQLLPLSELDARADELNRNVPLICVCRSGRRSAEAIRKLRALGFRDVTQLEGGLLAWEQAGLPVTRAAGAPRALERQVRFTQGFLILAGLALSLRWPAAIVVAWIIGVGMMFTSVIDWCGLALLMAKAPWNKRAPAECGR